MQLDDCAAGFGPDQPIVLGAVSVARRTEFKLVARNQSR